MAEIGWFADIRHQAILCYSPTMVEQRVSEAWMALSHVRPLPGHVNPLDDVSGMGWVLALAKDAEDYLELVTAEMGGLGLFIGEVDELDRYSAFNTCAEHIVGSFERLSEEWPVQYHTFHTTMIDDA